MFLVVVKDNCTSVHIEVVEHAADYLLTEEPWRMLIPCGTKEEVNAVLDVVLKVGELSKNG